jgi:meso-butanediol dehydrogenase/(S,S)-butanediol dehydrogenase/diacetyl reductase
VYGAPYAASKGALSSLTQSLAIEYAKRGLRAVARAPGGVKTGLIANVQFPEGFDTKLIERFSPVVALAESEEIAAAVAYLASGEARSVNGAVLAIDGAQTAG